MRQLSGNKVCGTSFAKYCMPLVPTDTCAAFIHHGNSGTRHRTGSYPCRGNRSRYLDGFSSVGAGVRLSTRGAELWEASRGCKWRESGVSQVLVVPQRPPNLGVRRRQPTRAGGWFADGLHREKKVCGAFPDALRKQKQIRGLFYRKVPIYLPVAFVRV